MINWIVSDLDGTLLNSDHLISQLSKQTLRQAVRQGKELVLATGRHYQEVYLLAQQLQVPCKLITSNGARVHCHSGELLYENHIPAECVADILALTSGFEVHRNIYQGDVWLVEEPNEPLLQIHHASGFGYHLIDFSEIPLNGIDKFYFNAPHDKLVPLKAKLKAHFGERLYITFTTETYLEVMNRGVSKGDALSHLLELEGVSPEEVVAFGDGFNDVEMLELVGYPVLMANAHPQLKAQLPQAAQALSNQENGVAEWLIKFGGIG